MFKNKLMYVLFLLICMLPSIFFSCANIRSSANRKESISDSQYMENFMKISTLVLNPELEGTGYWAYDDSLIGYGTGYWVSDDGKEIPAEDVFISQELKVGETYTLAPLSYDNRHYRHENINLHFEFDGILEIETENPDSNIIRLAYSLEEPYNPSISNWIEENSIHTNAPITINICPVGKELFLEGTQQLGIRDTLPDNEYRLYVRAYEYDGTLAVTAEIKLAVLPDEQYPWYEIYEDRYGELYSAGEKRSRFLSVELVSYEYSDLYKLMDE